MALLAALAVALTAIAWATPGYAAEPNCNDSLQSLVDTAAPGDVVEVPTCTYREKVAINKPITLQASLGAEIRGSDVWTDWTQSSGGYWTKGPLPSFEAHGRCSVGTTRCLWPEQVFLDGEPLEQVASEPKSGQFAVDSGRNVVLADDPAGHVVEVTTRTGWIVGQSDDVTVRGFTMRHSANDSQNGAIENEGYSRWSIEGNTLSDTHGAVVSLTEGTDLNLLNNGIYRGGQLGVHAKRGDVLVRGNEIHHNNTEGFDSSWEAGGMKTAGVLREGSTHSFTADSNEVYSNKGKGMWCDVECLNPTYSNNRVHHNEGNGIQLEITHGGKISGNVVWENGWGKPGWGWGAGILSSSSNSVEIHDNVVAWNADGISVISADREGTEFDEVKDVAVHHNKVLAEDRAEDPRHNFALAWLQDWPGVLFDPASNNRGYDNEYWYPNPESSSVRYEWEETGYRKLEDFNATPGEEGGRYLTGSEKDAVVESEVIPATGGPNQPSIDLDAASDSGVSSADNLTNDTTPTFTGTAEPGSNVRIFVDGAEKGSGTATGGSYSITTSELVAGIRSVTAEATGLADSVFDPSTPLSVTVDTAAPVAEPPAQSFVPGSQIKLATDTTPASVPIELGWSAPDDTGVAGQELQQSTNSGAYAAVSLPTPTIESLILPLTLGSTHRFRVRAQDGAGNWGGWTEGPSFASGAYQENVTGVSYPSGTWTRAALSGAYGGYVKHATASGARTRFTFTGRDVAWVAQKSNARGKAEVWLDGIKVSTVDLYSATGQARQVVFTEAVDLSSKHTLEVRVLGTKNAASGGKRVDVDAFLTLR